MATERVVVREISWRDVFPWLIIFRTFRLAVSLPVLFLATLGTVLTPVGWYLSEQLCVQGDSFISEFALAHDVATNSSCPADPFPKMVPNDGRTPDSLREILTTQPDIVEPIFRRFVAPVSRLLSGDLTLRQSSYYLIGVFWTLIVWAFFGGCITRLAVVKLGREEQIGLGEAIRHTRRRIGSYIISPLGPIVGILGAAIPMALMGLLMCFDVGVLIAGALWFFILLCGLAVTVFVLGLLFGWPLMWNVVSAEQQGDAFEAFSRSFSYTYQRPLHYLFYALVATFFGAICWLLVYQFSEAVIYYARWGTAIGAGSARWMQIERIIEQSASAGGPIAIGAWLIQFFEAVVRTIQTAFGYSFFWCLSSAIYLLLRRDVDQTEFDNIYIDNENLAYELPDLTQPKPSEESEKPASSENSDDDAKA